jgi:serine/threonine protein kinase
MSLTAGTRLGPYEIVSSLGAGGMGEVYRARDPRLHREVAIKVVQDGADGGGLSARFQREALAASALSNPHICAVYDVGETNGRPFLVMELVEGQTLHDFLYRGPADAATAIQIGVQIAEALEAAHAKGVIHRDIKPGNIMITGRRHVKVLDFGLAKRVGVSDSDRTTFQNLTQTGLIMGTPHYMSPEVLQGHPADERSDLWALGVVLYQMLSGRRPFEGTSAVAVASAVLHENAPPLLDTVTPPLRALVLRCLSKRPEERFQGATALREALEGIHAPAAITGASSDGQRTVTGGPASPNSEANHAFTLAMQFMRVQNDLARGQKQLERALELDPHFAEARRFHAFNYIIQVYNGFSNDASLLYAAEEELRQAEAECPQLASLPSAFAAVYLAQGRKEMIPIVELERVMAEDDPAARDALLWRAILYMQEGQSEKAKELILRSLEREPLFGAPRMIFADILRTEGDLDGAIREQQKVIEQGPSNISAIRWLARAYLDAGALDKARATLEESRAAFERNFLWRAAWALLLACEGKRTEALEAMDAETLKIAKFVFGETVNVAEFYAMLGDTTTAIEWIEVAVRSGDERIEWFARDRRLASIQQDPRFRRIVQSIESRRAHRAVRP